MARKNNEEKYNTLDFKKIFNEKVYFDSNHRVFYDRTTRCAVGYIASEKNNKIEIGLEMFPFHSNNYLIDSPDVTRLFNSEFITIKNEKEISYNYDGGYISIGKVINTREAELVLPRICLELDNAQIDDVDIDADPDPDDMIQERDPKATADMIAKLIN